MAEGGDPGGRRPARQRALLLAEAEKLALALRSLVRRAGHGTPSLEWMLADTLSKHLSREETRHLQIAYGKVEPRNRFKKLASQPREFLLAQLVRLVEQFIASDRLIISPPLFYQDDLRRRLIITLNMSRVVQHVADAIRQENTEKLAPVFDRDHPIRSTSDMLTWYTGKPCERTRKSHVNFCVYDSTWESSDAFVLDYDDRVAAWAKNDHLGFEILYIYRGVVKKYRPDFLVRLATGDMLVLETKGENDEQAKVKRRFLEEWTEAIDAHGGFGHWRCAVADRPAKVRDLLG